MNNTIQTLKNRIENFDAYFEMRSCNTRYDKADTDKREIKKLLLELSNVELHQIQSTLSKNGLHNQNRYFREDFERATAPTPPKANKSKIFKTAWQIFKLGFAKTFSNALSKAWTIIKISLGQGVNIEYAKDSGEVRTATALQLGSLSTIEKGFVRYLENINGLNQWRSFNIGRLIAS